MLLFCFQFNNASSLALGSQTDKTGNLMIFNSDHDKTYQTIIDILKERGETINRASKNKGVIECDYRRIELSEIKKVTHMPQRSESGGYSNPWLWARYRSTYRVKEIAPGQTQMEVILRFEGYSAPAGRYVRIASNGKIETEFFDVLASKLVPENVPK